MSRHLPTTLAIAVILLAGLAHGRRTDRWGVDHRLAEGIERLPRLPLTVGDWRGEDIPIDPVYARRLERGGMKAMVSRRYVDRRSGDAVSMLAVVGPVGPIALHTPEICYAGSGFELAAPAVRYFPPGTDSSFWCGDFRKVDAAISSGLRILWAWCPEGHWQAVESPRASFAAERVLFKVYVVRESLETAPPRDDDPGPRFLRALLPVLETTLFEGRRPAAARG
ncbi:MAG TPA: exosortase-associated EpsI family protein [Isosphaeraceae bacterium]|jgi:hypothetical protein|nr:exosortase-associated EpsI family protein [Isosphaeraceae bacterium]